MDQLTKAQNLFGTWNAMAGGFGFHGLHGVDNGKAVLLPPVAATMGSGALAGTNPYSHWWPHVYAPTASVFGYGKPWPGTYANYRIMLSHPTLALARASVVSPVLASSWTYEADDNDAPKEAKELIQKTFDPMRVELLRQFLRAIDFGFQAAEVTWRDDKGFRKPRAKFLLPDLTDFRIDENTGDVASLVNRGQDLPADQAAWFTYDREGDNHYGRARLENCRRAWSNYLADEDQLYRLEQKTAGILPKVGFPSDSKTPADAKDSNYERAKALANGLMSNRGVVFENMAGLSLDDVARNAELAGKSLWSIDVIDMGNTGPAQSGLLERLRYLDSMLVRGYLRSERSVIEAQTAGSRADAESHTATISDTDCDQLHADVTDAINRHMVDPMMAENFGPESVGTVRIVAREIVDERRAVMNQLLNAVLSDPQTKLEMFNRIDMDTVIDYVGIKKRDDAAPWDEIEDPTARQAEEDAMNDAMEKRNKE